MFNYGQQQAKRGREGFETGYSPASSAAAGGGYAMAPPLGPPLAHPPQQRPPPGGSWTLENNHPLIPNANQYFAYKQYVSVHSQDRDMTRFPNAAEFEIELPRQYLNVASIRLSDWSFPANYDVFSPLTYNVVMTFKFVALYDPSADHGAEAAANPVLRAIYEALLPYVAGDGTQIAFTIETGFYNPVQMATELTNKMNAVVTTIVSQYLQDAAAAAEAAGQPVPAWIQAALRRFTDYGRFQVIYNSVSQKLWFGNGADKFVLTNDSELMYKKDYVDASCLRRNMQPQFSSWGLPSYLGFTRCPAAAYSVQELLDDVQLERELPWLDSLSVSRELPRFYFTDSALSADDEGYWLLPSAPGATVYFLQAPAKVCLMGEDYIYMELGSWNCIDETSPWNLSEYTVHTNGANSRVNSSLAKLPVPTTPIAQWFDNSAKPYAYMNPPAERFSKVRIKFRYHDGQTVQFGMFNYSITLELTLLQNQPERSYSVRDASNLGQLQSYTSEFI
jgi:hypothetical protein